MSKDFALFWYQTHSFYCVPVKQSWFVTFRDNRTRYFQKTLTRADATVEEKVRLEGKVIPVHAVNAFRGS